MKITIKIPHRLKEKIEKLVISHNCTPYIFEMAKFNDGALQMHLSDVPIFWTNLEENVQAVVINGDDQKELREIFLESLRALKFENVENSSISYNKAMKVLSDRS